MHPEGKRPSFSQCTYHLHLVQLVLNNNDIFIFAGLVDTTDGENENTENQGWLSG